MQQVTIHDVAPAADSNQDVSENQISVRLQRWIDASTFGFWCGDHHIHGAGCSHYESPTEGVTPRDMFAQVKGEGLNVGCVLTWGPCFDHQRNYFSPIADTVSEKQTVLKYDLEISGFGSASLGHVCLLNLKDQTYPGSDGTKTRGWPTWTVPVMKWAKEQGGVTGYPHSALHVDPQRTAAWMLKRHDADGNGVLNRPESQGRLLPEDFSQIDTDGDSTLTTTELQSSAERQSQTLPNLAVPSMDGGGAMEIFVSTAEGVCDFISAMDTARIPEWNTWSGGWSFVCIGRICACSAVLSKRSHSGDAGCDSSGSRKRHSRSPSRICSRTSQSRSLWYSAARIRKSHGGRYSQSSCSPRHRLRAGG
jgi:hypothetical protein